MTINLLNRDINKINLKGTNTGIIRDHLLVLVLKIEKPIGSK